jgi:tRNA A-37 threonylcarbamoyl transferase component Bud32
MHLTPAGAVRYLLRRRYIPAESIVEGDLRVSEAAARNRGFRVTFGAARGYWVKQIREWTEPGVASFRREARWYWLVRNDPRFARFQDIVPACLAYDPDSEILVMDLVPGTQTLSCPRPHDPWFDPRAAALLGRTIARFQRDSLEPADAAGFSPAAPWVLSLAELGREPDPDRLGARRELLHILDAYPGFGPTLKALEEAWTPAALVHGDMKFQNCILGEDRITIIDWEMAGLGDPLWDAAGILQAYWEAWVRGIAPLETLNAAAREFWTSYVDELAPAGDPAEVLVRAVRYAGARLIQTVWEDRRYAAQLDDPTLKMLQLSLNIFADAPAVSRGLVGL